MIPQHHRMMTTLPCCSSKLIKNCREKLRPASEVENKGKQVSVMFATRHNT